ncbi:MAG TPA: proprotein convertase P-domain-containing protein [Pyrinomonadaceae bacterium]
MKKCAMFLAFSCLLVLSLTVLPTAFATRPTRRIRAAAKLDKISREDKENRQAAAQKRTSPYAQHPGVRLKKTSKPVPVSRQAVGFAVTPPLDEIEEKRVPGRSMRRGKAEANEERPEKVISPPASGRVDIFDPGFGLNTPAQDFNIAPKIPATIANFEGLSNLQNAADPVIAGLVLPPDTVGDVGPTQYVQATNLLFRVFDKTGTALTPARPISFLFTALGGRCANTDDGDPIVLYDSFADRWIITQFAVSGAAPLAQCFAISQTGDATGAYYTYEFVMPNAKFNDYPKFGVWPDGYYLSNNQFNLEGTAYLGVGVFALDRAKILAGDPAASYVYFDLESAIPNARAMLPSDADGLTPPPAGAPNVFTYYNADEFTGDSGDALRLFDFHADFAVPANSTFTERADSPLAVAAFNPTDPAGLDDIEQPPPSTATSALDAIQDRLMNRLQYRNFGSYEAMTVNHTVNVGTGATLATHQAGIRYYELRRALPSGAWTVRDQGTFAPDTDNRWLGSSALDNQGNLAVGYSVSSLTTFPGLRYAGRLAGDPLGQLAQGEATLINGAGAQTNTGSRWGDYSSLNVDPTDDCTFFYTSEYYATTDATPNDTPYGVPWQTRVGSFRFAECTAPAQGTLQVNITNCETGLPVEGATISIGGNLYGTTLSGGSFTTKLPPGTYSLSAARPTFASGTTGGVAVTNGNTTVVNLCITAKPLILSDGSAITAETCGVTTGAIDPAETVTVNLTLRNTGSADTSNLVATLLSTGGVTSPGDAQNYGAVVAGGASVTRSFTFTADAALSCGGVLVATLQLQDGTANLGTISYNFTTGAPSAPRPANTYSSGNIAAPLPDNTTVDIPINVSDAGVVADINVRLRMNHAYDGDVEIRIVHPDGTTVLLSDRRGGMGTNYGSGANDCSGTPTVFDDSAATSIAAGSAPFADSFRPEQALSAFNGKPAAGIWKLRVTDTANGDSGTIGCVQLEISRRIFLCCPFNGGVAGITAAPPATIAAESCSLNNSAPDPGETVTMNFPLLNTGTGPTSNLVATLLPTGGVVNPSAPQNYGALSPVSSSAVSRPFTFTAAGSCGSTLVATLQLQDGATNLGTVSFNITIGGTSSTATHFSNPSGVNILDTPRVGGVAPAAPYPSTIAVAGLTGTVTKVTVTLNNYSHAFPNDVDMLLVGPGGRKVLLISDVGGTLPVSNRTFTLDDAAEATIPTGIADGTYRPSNSGTGDSFPAPAPPGPHSDPQLLSVFNGQNPNGVWSLYVVDDAGTDAGSIGGWTLNITTTVPACCFRAGNLLISEFRFRGLGGANDEFVELYNNTDAAIDVPAGGWTLRRTDTAGALATVFTIPPGASIPARGHYLAVNNTPAGGFTSNPLSTYPAGVGTVGAGDAQFTADLPDGGGIALFSSGTIFDATTLLDAVGFAPGAGSADALYREGAGISPAGGISADGQYSFARKLTTGLPQDTGNNANDFVFVSTTGGSFSGTQSTLGAPGPESLASPIQRNATLKASLVNGSVPATVPPNRVRSGQIMPGVPNAYGTLSIQRRFRNTGIAPITRLRFRITQITTLGSPAAVASPQADLRVLSSTGVVTDSAGNVVTTVTGLTLESTGSSYGGLNSSLTVVMPGGGLTPGNSIEVQFLLGVQEQGNFIFLVNVEALLGAPGSVEEGATPLNIRKGSTKVSGKAKRP